MEYLYVDNVLEQPLRQSRLLGEEEPPLLLFHGTIARKLFDEAFEWP